VKNRQSYFGHLDGFFFQVYLAQLDFRGSVGQK